MNWPIPSGSWAAAKVYVDGFFMGACTGDYDDSWHGNTALSQSVGLGMTEVFEHCSVWVSSESPWWFQMLHWRQALKKDPWLPKGLDPTLNVYMTFWMHVCILSSVYSHSWCKNLRFSLPKLQSSLVALSVCHPTSCHSHAPENHR